MKNYLIIMVVVVLMQITNNTYALTSFWHSGIAVDNVGQILDNANVDVRVTIYDAAGSQLYQQTFSGVWTSQFAVYRVHVDGYGTGEFAEIDADAGTLMKVELRNDNGWGIILFQTLSSAQYNSSFIPDQIDLPQDKIIMGGLTGYGEGVEIGGILTAYNNDFGEAVFSINHDESLQIFDDLIGINHEYENHWAETQYFQNIFPEDNNQWDLGSDELRWHGLWLSGSGFGSGYAIHLGENGNEATINYDVFSSSLDITAPQITINDDLYVSGNATLGNEAMTDITTFNSRIGSDFLPLWSGSYNLGSSEYKWEELWLSGAANIDGSSTLGSDATTDITTLNSALVTNYNSNSTGTSFTIPTGTMVMYVTSPGGVQTFTASLPGGTNGQILYVYYVATGADVFTINSNTYNSSANIVLVYANGGWRTF